MHTHLGEGENEGMVARWGKRTMDWCAELGFIGEDVWVCHDWEVTPEEYRVLASHQNRGFPLSVTGHPGRFPHTEH